jgi:chromate reductase
MITIISGTNRKGSECLQFAKKYAEICRALTNEEVKVLSLEDAAHDWFHPNMYEESQMSPSLIALQDEYMIPADRFIYLIPEYNGGFPGVLKLFIDACSVRQYDATFKGKKAALVGIATGRAGNLRGMDQLTGVLNHVGTIVLPNKLPISRIYSIMNKQGEIVDMPTQKVMQKQVEELLAL